MKTYRDFGIILKKHELGEADSIVLMLTRGQGLVRSVAKGVRRMTSRKGGNVELFNQVDAMFSRGKSLDILTEATALDTYSFWRSDLERVSQAFYVADLTSMMLAEGETYEYMYDQLANLYAWLGYAADPGMLVRWYEVQLLSSLGFWSSGQLQSQSQNALKLLEHFPVKTAKEVSQLKSSPALSTELERLMRGRLIEVLDREPKSEEFIYQVRALEQRAII